ncbi:hypothetical protein KY285_012784 [Solanum tuberosum]|nr:hypothetical protein KY285_012784 [Solanum tuberosum]
MLGYSKSGVFGFALAVWTTIRSVVAPIRGRSEGRNFDRGWASSISSLLLRNHAVGLIFGMFRGEYHAVGGVVYLWVGYFTVGSGVSGRRSRIAWNLRSSTELILPVHSSWHWAGPPRVIADSSGRLSGVLDGTLDCLGLAPGVLAYLAVGFGLLKGNDRPPRETRLAGSCPGVPGGLGGLMLKSDLLTMFELLVVSV